MTATTRHASPATRERRLFPGRRWVAVAAAFSIAGLVGGTVGGAVDAVGAALVGGAVVFMLLSGLALARFTGARGQAA